MQHKSIIWHNASKLKLNLSIVSHALRAPGSNFAPPNMPHRQADVGGLLSFHIAIVSARTVLERFLQTEAKAVVFSSGLPPFLKESIQAFGSDVMLVFSMHEFYRQLSSPSTIRIVLPLVYQCRHERSLHGPPKSSRMHPAHHQSRWPPPILFFRPTRLMRPACALLEAAASNTHQLHAFGPFTSWHGFWSKSCSSSNTRRPFRKRHKWHHWCDCCFCRRR